jgi:A/G-specific adenine glycosylase
MNTAEIRQKTIADALLAWYDQNARILPWRDNPVPYHVWVSEIMLQQTQVQTVLPYFERFILALPSIEALALAEESKILKLWEGLGYYNRVRNMQRTARRLMEQYDGRLPADYALLVKLPGIGAYTAGAIASIAYNKTAAAIDGNVLRVFSRITGSREDIGKISVKREFQTLALELQPRSRPGDFNQALMELGAKVCVPKAEPFCAVCPVATFCVACRDQITGEIPVKAVGRKRTMEMKTVLIIRAKEMVLLRKRAEEGLLAGLWEPYTIEGFTTEEGIAEIIEELGFEPLALHRLEQAIHQFTHKEWQLQGFFIEVKMASPPKGSIWAGHEEITDEITVPSAFKAYKKYLPRGITVK